MSAIKYILKIFAFLSFINCKKLNLVQRQINPNEFQHIIPENYRPVNFTDLSTRRVNITGIFISPCYETPMSKITNGCGFVLGQEAIIDIRFKVKGKKSLGIPKLTQEATIGDCHGKLCPRPGSFLYNFMNGLSQKYDLGDYADPCKVKESNINCPIRADTFGQKEHQMIVKLLLPTSFLGFPVPETNLTSKLILKGRRRRAHLGVTIPLETIID